jgi:uncharacterized membrane protein
MLLYSILLTKISAMLDVLVNQPEEKPGERTIFKVSDRADKPVKSIMKAVSWRIVGTIDTMVISYIITGRVTVAVSIGGIEVFTKILLYYLHERFWAHIHKIRMKGIFKKKDKKYKNTNYEVKGVEKSAVGQDN